MTLNSNMLITILVFLVIFSFLLQYYEPSLLLSETTTSGGDTASDYYPATIMNELLSEGKVTGWSHGWFGGFPMLQFYFPLPFVLMTLLSKVIPLSIAFKLVTALGVFLLPVMIFFSLKSMKFNFPVPTAGAILSLPFLFMEANSMWGGNIPSTLAGEFSYGISMALSILFLGLVYGDTKKVHWIRNSAIFALILFSHVITALWVVLVTSYFLLVKERKINLGYFFKLYLLAFLLLGAWIFPLLMNLEYTSTYADTWNVTTEEVLPPSVIIFLMLLIPTLLYTIQNNDKRIVYLAYACVSAFILFLLGEIIGVVNIRFIPFLQIGLLMLSAIGFMLLKQKKLILIIFLALTVFVVNDNITYIDDWTKWNYDGFEKKGGWETYREINELLSGDISDPRVVYEHSEHHNLMGTPRAFESLPLFSGRSTLEGLFMQSSPSSPFVFYIQSEVSDQQSCPFYKDYPCTTFNLENGIEHLKLFNVQHYIAISGKAKTAAENNEELELIKNISTYKIFELITNENRYVTVPKYEPVKLETNSWRDDAYTWFKKDTSIFLVRNGDIQQKATLDNIPKISVDNDCIINETIENEKIEFTTNCVGKPHIIKVSYYPMWQADNEKVYTISPYFMLVYPENEKVTIRYKNTYIELIGIILTLIGFGVLIYLSIVRILNFIKATERSITS
jgi:hypothetical protein